MNYPKRYLDTNDVERGYYVYAHVDKATGKVFYVGKGCDGRAWSDERSYQWHEYIERLPEGYEVRLLHTDLTEDESLEIEADEIENNGGCEVKGGTLLNRYPGDREMEIGATIFAMDATPSEEYAAAREAANAVQQFADLSPKERVEACRKWEDIVEPLWDKFDERFSEFIREDRNMPDLYEAVHNDVDQIETLAIKLARKKISYEDFCDDVPFLVESLWDALDECKNRAQIRRVKPLLEAIKKWWSQFEIEGGEEAANEAYYAKVAEIEGLEGGAMEARNLLNQKVLAALEQLKHAR